MRAALTLWRVETKRRKVRAQRIRTLARRPVRQNLPCPGFIKRRFAGKESIRLRHQEPPIIGAITQSKIGKKGIHAVVIIACFLS